MLAHDKIAGSRWTRHSWKLGNLRDAIRTWKEFPENRSSFAMPAGDRNIQRAHVRKLGRRFASSGTCRARLILNTCFLVLAGPVPMRGEWSLCSIMPCRNVHVCRSRTVTVLRLYPFTHPTQRPNFSTACRCICIQTCKCAAR